MRNLFCYWKHTVMYGTPILNCVGRTCFLIWEWYTDKHRAQPHPVSCCWSHNFVISSTTCLIFMLDSLERLFVNQSVLGFYFSTVTFVASSDFSITTVLTLIVCSTECWIKWPFFRTADKFIIYFTVFTFTIFKFTSFDRPPQWTRRLSNWRAENRRNKFDITFRSTIVACLGSDPLSWMRAVVNPCTAQEGESFHWAKMWLKISDLSPWKKQTSSNIGRKRASWTFSLIMPYLFIFSEKLGVRGRCLLMDNDIIFDATWQALVCDRLPVIILTGLNQMSHSLAHLP